MFDSYFIHNFVQVFPEVLKYKHSIWNIKPDCDTFLCFQFVYRVTLTLDVWKTLTNYFLDFSMSQSGYLSDTVQFIETLSVCQNGSFLKDLSLLKDLFGQKGFFLVFFYLRSLFFLRGCFHSFKLILWLLFHNLKLF